MGETPPLPALSPGKRILHRVSMTVYADGTATIDVPPPQIFWWLHEELAAHARRLYARQAAAGGPSIVDPSGAVRLE